MIENSMLKWFLKPGLFASRIGFGFLQKSADKILGIFDQLAGVSFLHELAEMVSAFASLLGGFGDRAGEVYRLLRTDSVSFVLVATPETTALQDALYFHQEIGNFELPLAGFILNRVYSSYLPPTTSLNSLKEELGNLSESSRNKLLQNLGEFQMLHEQQQHKIRWLQSQCGPKLFYTQIPFFETDIHDMAGLAKLGKALFTK